MSRTVLGLTLCGLAMVTVGSTVVASKLIVEGLSPFTAVALRFGLALPCFVALMALTRTPWPRPSAADARLLVVQAGLGSVGYTVLLMLGVGLGSAGAAGIAAGTLTPMVALVAWLLLRERPGAVQFGAIGLASAGVLLVTSGGSAGEAGPGALAGVLLVLGAVVCEAVFLLLNRRLRQPIAALPLSATMSALGFALALPFALIEQPWRAEPSAAALLAVLYYALVPTVAGFLLWYAGSARITAGLAGIATGLLPVSAVLLAWLVLGEVIGARQWLGMGCVLAAVVLAAWPRRAIAASSAPARDAR